MITCKYCGQKLKKLDDRKNVQFFHCSFCEMDFPVEDTCIDRKRKASELQCHEFTDIYLSTADFLERDTYTLYHALKDIRRFWYDIKTLLENIKSSLISQDDKVIFNEVKSEFIVLTKKRFVVESILFERTGFIPDKITEEFLNTLYQQAENSNKKSMFIYIK